MTGNRLSLPITGLLFRPEGTMAAVVGADDRIELKRVTIGRDFGTTVEILQGLDPADQIVDNPPDSMEAGQQVHVQTPSGRLKKPNTP
jgi:hypothetical protein